VLTLTFTTFTFVVIICVSITNWTYVIATNFPWNIFCISTHFGQSVILCPFEPQMWHAYEDVLCGFWLVELCGLYGFHCNMLFILFTCFHIMFHHLTICAMFVNLPYITLCFCWCYMFSTLWYWKCTPCFCSSHVFFTQHCCLFMLL
jgi:hypothetical protein